jgi:hypothetical protein
MGIKSKYNFSNQCYHDILKLIIDLIPGKHNMSKDLYQLKKIVAGLGMNYEKIDVYEKELHVVLKGAQGRYRMYTLWYVQIRESGKRRRSLYYHKSGDETASLHACHSKAQTVVPIRRNSETDEVAQGKET